MSEHPAADQWIHFMRGQLRREQVVSLARHLEACAQCQDAAAGNEQVVRSTTALKADLLQTAKEQRSPATRGASEWRRWPLAAAVAFALIGMSAFISVAMWQRQSSPPSPERPRVDASTPSSTPSVATPRRADVADEWEALVERTRRGAPVGTPSVMRSILQEADVLRGDVANSGVFAPSGVVVKSPRPELTWPAEKDAQSEVQIFRGDEEVARSPLLSSSRWRPERSLARGVTYTWQVRVTRNGETRILPASPTPVARFYIVDAETLADLESAERSHPGDHLLLGIVHARAGLDAEARGHLEQVTDSRDAGVARRILREIASRHSS